MSRKKVLMLDEDKDKSPSLVRVLQEMGYPNVEFLEVSTPSEIPKGISPHLTIIDLDHSLDISQISPYLLNNGSVCFGITTKNNVPIELSNRIKTIYHNMDELCYSSDNILRSNKINHGRIGIVGMGRIGESLLTQLVQRNKIIGIEEAIVYHRPKEEDRVKGIVKQLDTIKEKFPIYSTSQLSHLGKNSEIIVVTIGKKESVKLNREDFIGKYFKDIKEIMEGLGDTEATVFIATNPVTPNCLVANIYSKNQKVIGFTRLDYIRAKYLLRNWLKTEGDWGEKADDVPIELDVLGPHGFGLLITNIKIGEKGKLIYTNEDLAFYFKNSEGMIEKLSKETAKYGEDTASQTAPDRTPALYAMQIVESLDKMLRKGRDIVAVDVNLDKLCKNGLELPKSPIYMSFPVIYNEGIPRIDPNFDIKNIPENYRVDLLHTLRKEERRIKNYLRTHRNGFSKLREHFDLQ